MSELEDTCRFFATVIEKLRIGGIYGIPRSGLLFKRTGRRQLVLIDRMPYNAAMPISSAQLEQQQRADYEGMQGYGEMCGWLVTDETQ